jgi:CHAT domain-containing protein
MVGKYDRKCPYPRLPTSSRASEKDIWLGDRAAEAEIKRLSEAGELAKYRIIHFATHGALAGQVGGNSEPGLILTPPETATERDDGYLSASEIAQLKLDADWVILSACNTAAGSVAGAEALSGLARAFFYAGARAILVSHWAVASEVTVKLITGAVGRMAADKRIGRTEAMRQSMLALIDKGDAQMTHPAFWAPFVVVGEGEAAQYESASSPMPATTPHTPTVPAQRRQRITTPDWRNELWRR